MSSKEAEIRNKIIALKQREAELLDAKKRLENRQRSNRAELAKISEQAKRDGRQEIIEKIIPILPSPTNSLYMGAARTLNNDVRKILDQYQKKKNN